MPQGIQHESLLTKDEVEKVNVVLVGVKHLLKSGLQRTRNEGIMSCV